MIVYKKLRLVYHWLAIFALSFDFQFVPVMDGIEARTHSVGERIVEPHLGALG